MLPEKFKLGAAQVEPVYHDKEATIDKAIQWIERASNDGVDLLVFPETFVPGYPYWRGFEIPQWSEKMVELQKNSISEGDEEVEKLQESISDANLHVALGANEVSDRTGSNTIYNSIFFFDRNGELIRKHRKLMPTHTERAVWGRGDPSSLSTHDSDIGRIGGLICYENHMTMSKAALTTMGEEIHPAVWPGFWEQEGHPGNKKAAETEEAIKTCDQYAAMREYAFETQSYVASASTYMSDDVLEDVSGGDINYNIAAGGSMLINPAGIVKEGPVIGEEALLTAEFTSDERRATKAYFDALGHYSRWDAVNLNISGETLEPSENNNSSPNESYEVSSHDIQDIAEEVDVDIEIVEKVIDQVS